jgi:hypothetical protein
MPRFLKEKLKICGDSLFHNREVLKKKKKYNSSLLGFDHPIPVKSVKKYCLVPY